MDTVTEGNLAVVSRQTGEISLMGVGSAVEMQRALDEMQAKIKLVQQFIKEVMVEGLDVGVIPGTDKRALFQPGADKLNALFGFARFLISKDEVKDHNTGHYDVTVRVGLRHKATGTVVGEAEGTCSTRESKYAYRWVYESQVPVGIDKNTLVSQTFKARAKPGQREEDRAEYVKYRLDNDDLFSLWNTVLQMAIKRGYVAVTKNATGLSGIFNLDEKDLEAWMDGEEIGKERLEKQKKGPKAGDEKADFNPFAVDGGGAGGTARGANDISEPQEKKIIGDAKRKGVDEAGIKALVVYTKKKPLDKLTKAEASAVIDFLTKTEQADLQALAAKAAEATPQWTAEELGDK